MSIRVKRIYAAPEEDDGFRALVDHLWPRGLKKEDARIDRWFKEIAPTAGLRKWFGHDPEKWEEFKRRYFEELDTHQEAVNELIEIARKTTVTLLFAAKNEEFNNAVALRDYIEKRSWCRRSMCEETAYSWLPTAEAKGSDTVPFQIRWDLKYHLPEQLFRDKVSLADFSH